MKILQVIPSLASGFGGPSSAMLGLSESLIRQGQEVTVFTTNADVKGNLDVPLEVPVKLRGGVRVLYFPVQLLHGYKFSLPLRNALRRDIPGFDIVHIHSCFQFPSLAASFLCRKYHKPYIIRPLGQLDPFLLKRNYLIKRIYLSLFELKGLEAASALHCTTQQEKEWCQLLGLRTPNLVIPLGVDLREFESLPPRGVFRAKYPELKDKKIILFLSRINFKKGLDILVDAFAQLSRNDDLYLVIAGPDNEGYGAVIKERLRGFKILNRVVFTGMLQGENKLAAFRDSDVFVLPSYSENFGLAAIEAMAAGLPVVISDKVGIHDDVQRNNSGIVAQCNSSDIARAIRFILDNKDAAGELSLNAKKMTQNLYNLDNIAERLLEEYENILKKADIVSRKYE